MKRLARVIISVTILCISLAGAAFFAWPNYQEFSLLRARVQEDKDRLERGQEALAQLRKVQEEVLSRQEDFAKIDQAIPQDAGLPALYEHIQQLGSASGLILTSIEGQVAAPESDSAIVSLALKAQFAGSYEGLKNFLDEARRSARIFNVSALDISAGGENPGDLQIVIELFAYAAP